MSHLDCAKAEEMCNEILDEEGLAMKCGSLLGGLLKGRISSKCCEVDDRPLRIAVNYGSDN